MISTIADLVTFLRRFHRHWLDEPALDPALIPPDLPPPLAEIYRELGALIAIDPPEPRGDGRTPFAAQDGLMPLSRLRRIDGMIEFAWENQGNWSARCRPGLPDPPVYSDAADIWESPPRGHVIACDSLAHFLLTLCLQEAVMSCRHLTALDTDRHPADVFTVRTEPVWLDGWLVNGDEDRRSFFVSPEHDVLVMDWRQVSAGLWVGSPSREVSGLVVQGIKSQVIHGSVV